MNELQDINNMDENKLLMEPWDWERFGKTSQTGHGYHYAVRSLGDLKDKIVLDVGCGDGWFSVILAKLGAKHVYGFDISDEYISIAQKRAKINNVEDKISFNVKSFYDIDYKEDFFDVAVGFAILHHVNIDNIIMPLQKVLKDNGKAVFVECFGNSLLLERLRLLVPVPIDDHNKSNWSNQIKYKDIERFYSGFKNISWKEFQLLSRLDRVISNEKFIGFLNRFDSFLLKIFPILKRYARVIVIKLENPLKGRL